MTSDDEGFGPPRGRFALLSALAGVRDGSVNSARSALSSALAGVRGGSANPWSPISEHSSKGVSEQRELLRQISRSQQFLDPSYLPSAHRPPTNWNSTNGHSGESGSVDANGVSLMLEVIQDEQEHILQEFQRLRVNILTHAGAGTHQS